MYFAVKSVRIAASRPFRSQSLTHTHTHTLSLFHTHTLPCARAKYPLPVPFLLSLPCPSIDNNILKAWSFGRYTSLSPANTIGKCLYTSPTTITCANNCIVSNSVQNGSYCRWKDIKIYLFIMTTTYLPVLQSIYLYIISWIDGPYVYYQLGQKRLEKQVESLMRNCKRSFMHKTGVSKMLC